MKSQARQSGLPAVVAASLLLLLCTWLQGVHTQVHTRVDVLTDSCDSQLTWLWGNYSSPPVAPVAGCDTACLAGCGSTLDEAIYSEKVQHCPLQTDIIRCFHVYRAQWSKFVAECALFQYPASSSSSTPAATTTPSSSSSSSSPPPEGAAVPSPPVEGSAAASAAVAGRRRALLTAEGVLGNGIISGSGNNTNTTVDVTNGCFPAFTSTADFEGYINGLYTFPTSSAAVGITLSVIFYLSLALLGIGLPKGLLGKLNCFRRRPTKLPAPAAAAAAADANEPLTGADACSPGDAAVGGANAAAATSET